MGQSCDTDRTYTICKMTAIHRMVFAALLIFVVNFAKAQNNVPVYMWNIDTEAVANPFRTLNSGELVDKLASSLDDHQLIAIFMQDDLSIEDFKSDDLSSLKSVVESDNDGTYYHPSISNPENLPKSFVGIFTAVKNSKSVVATHKVKRAAPAPGIMEDINLFLNASGIFLFIEKPPVLKLKNDNQWSNFTLNTEPVVVKSANSTLVLEYTNIQGEGPQKTLNTATISLTFVKRNTGYWNIEKAVMDYSSTIDGKSYGQTGVTLKSADISSPFGFSYHCTPKLALAVNIERTIIFETNGLQLEPFKANNADSFGDWYDCQGFFTVAIWAGIFLGLVIAAMLAWLFPCWLMSRVLIGLMIPKAKPSLFLL